MFPHGKSWRDGAPPMHPLFHLFFGAHDHEGGSGRRGRGRGRGHGSGGPLGGRRPLRFLARRLGLDDDQIATLARVLGDLKIEREQMALDSRRAAARFADALAADEFDEKRVSEAQTIRADAQKRYIDAFARGLRDIHAALTPEQRSRMSLLLREMPPWAL